MGINFTIRKCYKRKFSRRNRKAKRVGKLIFNKMKKLELKKELIVDLTRKEQSSINGGGTLLTLPLMICKTVQTGATCYPTYTETNACGTDACTMTCEQCEP